MLMYAKILNDETKEVSVGFGTNTAFYEKIGMTLQDVEQSSDGRYFLAGYAPEEPKESEADKAQDEIYRLEMEQKPRLMREAINDLKAGLKSSYALDKLAEIDEEIVKQRAIIQESLSKGGKRRTFREFLKGFFSKKKEEESQVEEEK